MRASALLSSLVMRPSIAIASSWVVLAGAGAATPPADAATYRSCRPVVDPYAGTRYEGTDLTRIRALRVSCATARRVARGAHRKALGLGPTESGIRTFTWNGWRVRGDLRGSADTYRAAKGTRRVRWVF